MHNFKKFLKLILCIVLTVLVIKGIDTALYPCTFMRNDVHAITSQQQDLLILGTSNGKLDMDPDSILEGTDQTGHNLCVGGEYPIDAYYLLKLAIEKQNPKRVIYEVDPSYFMSEKEEGNNYLLFYHEFPLSQTKLEYFGASMIDCDFRTSLFNFYEYPLSYELPRIGETFSKKIQGDYSAADFKSDTQEYHENGFIERYPVAKDKMNKSDIVVFEEAELKQRNMEYLSKIVALCRESKIEFCAVTTPLPSATLKKYTENYEAAWDYFSGFFQREDVPYYNFNREYYDAYTHKLSAFTDYEGHMNGDSARAYSKVLGDILNSKTDEENTAS